MEGEHPYSGMSPENQDRMRRFDQSYEKRAPREWRSFVSEFESDENEARRFRDYTGAQWVLGKLLRNEPSLSQDVRALVEWTAKNEEQLDENEYRENIGGFIEAINELMSDGTINFNTTLPELASIVSARREFLSGQLRANAKKEVGAE